MRNDEIVKQLRRHESCRSLPYDDATGRTFRKGDTLIGNLTIGIGINLMFELYPEEISFLLENRIRRFREELTNRLPVYSRINYARQDVLVNMAFQMGVDGVLRFKRMISALMADDFMSASNAMLDSDWARKHKTRADELSRVMKEGK